jgi:hypothetical protein
MDEDIFDSLLHLEDGYYNDGYRLGVEDGSRAGRIEGRVFGLEQGFEKFLEMGKLNGRACVWAARMPQKATMEGSLKQESQPENPNQSEGERTSSAQPGVGESLRVAPFQPNSRLEKHISILYGLSEAESLSTENTEDTVSDFDDRFKRAQSKAKVIETIIKEREVDLGTEAIENKKKASGSKSDGVHVTKAAAAEKNMEDFGLKPTC